MLATVAGANEHRRPAAAGVDSTMDGTPRGVWTIASRRAFVLGALGSLAGCADPENGSGAQSVAIAPGVILQLPPPASLGRTIEVAQLIEARRQGDKIMAFEARLRIDAQHLLLAVTDTVGRRALTVEWTGSELRSQAADWLPDGLRARNMLGDIVLLYWPQAVVQTLLAASGATLVDAPSSRVVRVGERDLVRITYQPDQAHVWRGLAHYRNLGWGYDLDIRSSEVGR